MSLTVHLRDTLSLDVMIFPIISYMYTVQYRPERKVVGQQLFTIRVNLGHQARPHPTGNKTNVYLQSTIVYTVYLYF